jgi:hypothetical protein
MNPYLFQNLLALDQLGNTCSAAWPTRRSVPAASGGVTFAG